MVQYKVLILLTVATIILNNKQEEFEMQHECSTSILFKSIDASFELQEFEYSLIEDTSGYDLVIKSPMTLDSLRTLIKPTIVVCVDNISRNVDGVDVFSSFVPEHSDFFYSLGKDGRIYFFGKNKIIINKVLK